MPLSEKFRSQLRTLLLPYLSPLPPPINTSVLSGTLKYPPCPLNGESILSSLLTPSLAQHFTVVRADCDGADVEVPWMKKLRNKEASSDEIPSMSTLKLRKTRGVLRVNKTLAEVRRRVYWIMGVWSDPGDGTGGVGSEATVLNNPFFATASLVAVRRLPNPY